MGLLEAGQRHGVDGVEILASGNAKALLGNAIASLCADYIIAGIYEVLADWPKKEE